MNGTRAAPARPQCWELAGPDDAPVILALGGISATRHVVRAAPDDVPGWWDAVAGPGRALDTGSRRVLGVDFIDGGRAVDGRPARVVTTHDQAVHIVAILDELGIERLSAVVGASYGGMVALALAERFPERVERLVVVSAAHATHPMATAIRAVQRRIVELGLETGRGADAMALARALAMTTYRTRREFAGRFGTAPDLSAGESEFEVERYLTRAGRTFAERTRPERFLALSLSADLHRVEPERVRVPATVIAARGDTLVPPSQSRVLARRLPLLRAFHLLETRKGHDAFLTEPRRLTSLLAPALSA